MVDKYSNFEPEIRHHTSMGSAGSTSSRRLEDDWDRTYEAIKTTHDAAYCAIEEAITLEEQEKPHEAIEKYKQGIFEIDKALNIQVTCPENPSFTWEKALVMIQKMKKTRAEVLTRINSIQSSDTFEPREPPPSYDEAMASCSSASSTTSSNSAPRTYKELATALENLNVESQSLYNHTSIIYTHDNVRLYMISPTGQVLSTTGPETLTIAAIEGPEGTSPSIYLQVGSWIYPLVPGVSPCYRTDYGAFILPDVHSDVPGSSIGIILPSDADEDVYDLLENILHGIVCQTPAYAKETGKGDLSNTISKGLVTGACYISRGLIKGAEKAGDLINNKTPELINKITPAQQAARINPKLSKGLKIAGTATNGAVQVTGFVANKVGSATSRLGKFLAPHIQKHGTRILQNGFHMSEQEASSKVNGILTVAAGAVESFSTVYNGLETSASILGQNLKNNTVRVVDHTYGRPAGEATDDTLTTVGNVWTINRNIRGLTPKGLAVRTAKDTGKAVVDEHRQSLTNGNPNSIMVQSTSNGGLSTVYSAQNPQPSTSTDSLPPKKE